MKIESIGKNTFLGYEYSTINITTPTTIPHQSTVFTVCHPAFYIDFLTP